MSKLRNKFIAVLAVLLCAMLCLSAAFLIPNNKSANAARSAGTANWTIIGSANNDIYKGINSKKPFDGDLLSELYKALTGEETIDGVESALNNSSSIASNGDKVLTSADFRKQQGGTKNVSVWFGGIKWDATYITKDRSGNIILDLWQSTDGANATQGTPASGATYLATIQYNVWSSGSVGTDTYPANMYSTSKVRIDGLNVEGQWSTAAETLESKQSQNPSHQYARFTMASVDNSLVNYIVTPSQVAYQATENNNGNSSINYTLPNDAYGTPVATTKTDGSPAAVNWYTNMNYTGKGGSGQTAYADWQNDYLWLPSLAEAGISDNTDQNGIWKTNTDLRSTVTSYYWLRSGYYISGSAVCLLPAGGDGTAINTFSVRPALHLNLTLADEHSSYSIAVPTDVSNAYNGNTQTLNDLKTKPTWYNEDLYDNVSIKVEFVGNMTDVAEHTVRATILDDHYYWADNNTSSDTREFKFKITKAPLNVQTLRVDENGNLQGDGSINDIITNTYLSTSLYPRDVGKSSAPKFGIQYKRTNGGSWSTTVPDTAGEYYVRAYIINDDNLCNYYLASDGQTTFKKPKEYVETPHFTQEGLDATAIVGSTTTVQYSGDYQEFKLVNTPDNKLVGVNIGERTGGLSYDQKTGTFRAKAVGVYTVEALLEDGGANTQWDNDAPETSRIITLIITKAELHVNVVNSDITSWTKGEIDYITVEVTGVRNAENVKLDVYYTVTGSSAKTYVADSAMNLNEAGDTIIVTVNLATFDTNKEYQLFVALREDIAVNDNYTIVNNSEPYKFFIMTATINDDEVVEAWTISNVITGTKEATNGTEVDYNGSSYTVALDESKLPKGLEFSYTNESFTDVRDGGYTTKVMITCESGYQLASGKTSISFEISWKINPIVFDIVDLVWADNPEYSGNTQTMGIINPPSWLSGNVSPGGTYSKKDVGKYTATYTLFSDGNYTFVYTGEDNENNIIGGDGLQATLKHDWEITKKIINVTNAPKQWTTESVEYFDGETYYYYNIYIPDGLDTNLIKVTYWKDEKFTEPVDNIKTIQVNYEDGEIYYIKIEIADAYASDYALYNTVTKEDYAYTSFKVGGNITIIEVDYDSDGELMYNGETRDITATYRDLKFKYTYYEMLEGGSENPLEGAPKEVGNYKLVVSLDGEDANEYWIQNSVFYFTITPLVLTTDGYKPAKGNELKESYVIADAVEDTSPYFEYQVYDKSNRKIDYPNEQLLFNTTYTVKLVIKGEHKEHAVWADDAVTTYIFTTSYDPSAGTQYFDDPTITVTDKDGKTVDTDSVIWTGDDYTVTIDNWEALSPFVTVTIDGEEDNSGSYIFTNVGIYTITITINEAALQDGVAGWLWDSGSASKTLTFEIIKRYVAIPTANGEVGYTGEEQYLFPEGYEENYIILSDGAIISATEIGGEWVVTLSLKDKVNSCWADGTTDDKTFTWSIVEATDDPNNPGGEDDEDLAKKKEEAKKDLEDVAQKKRDEIDADPDMTDEEKEEAKKQVDEELQKGKDAIDSATTSSGVDSAFNQGKKNIEDIGLKSDSSSFPWWILAVIGAALLLLLLLIIIIIKRRQVEYEDDYYDDEYDFDEEIEEEYEDGDDF